MAVESSTRCPQCGTSNPPPAQFCMQCGTPLPGTAAAGRVVGAGDAVNFAARLQTQDPPDGIVMDERTCEAPRRASAYEMLPLVESAEFGARPRCRVIRLTDQPPTRRLQAEMIGRD